MHPVVAVKAVTLWHFRDQFEGEGSRSESDCQITNRSAGFSVSRIRTGIQKTGSCSRSRPPESDEEE